MTAERDNYMRIYREEMAKHGECVTERDQLRADLEKVTEENAEVHESFDTVTRCMNGIIEENAQLRSDKEQFQACWNNACRDVDKLQDERDLLTRKLAIAEEGLNKLRIIAGNRPANDVEEVLFHETLDRICREAIDKMKEVK